jgi:hypothetical protein
VTGVLGSISGQFGKSLILGTFFPVLLFVTFAFLFWLPLMPDDLGLLSQLETLDPQWRVLSFTVVALVLTGLLYNLNGVLVRFYEGYPWRESWTGKWKSNQYKSNLEDVVARRAGVRTLVYFLRAARDTNESLAQARLDAAERVQATLPFHGDHVLPTRMGNVIRAFEFYSNRQYGIDAIVLWPRLVSKIDKEYAAGIEDTKASFDFVFNTSVLSTGLAIGLLLTGVVYPTPLASADFVVPWLVEIVFFTLAAYFMYLAAIGRAGAWGALVKGAFDSYRLDLLKQFGFSQMPRTLAEERRVWQQITVQMLFGDTPRVPLLEYESPSTSARAEPESYVQLEIARGLMAPNTDGSQSVIISIRNIDAQRRAASAVIVTDKLPSELEYEWDSALVDGRAAQVAGANPYTFRLGSLAPGATLQLVYRAIPRHNGKTSS